MMIFLDMDGMVSAGECPASRLYGVALTSTVLLALGATIPSRERLVISLIATISR